jgi:O-antigen/teichoic acid export membrane protein
VIGLSGLAFVVQLWPVWIDSDSSAPWKSYVCVIAVTMALAQIAGMLGRRRASDPPSIRLLVWTAGILAVVLAVMAIAAALAEVDDAGYYQLFGVIVVLDVLAIALQPAVRRLATPAPASGGGERFVCVLANGRREERTAGPDLAEAVARALREFHGHDERVTRIEFGAG